MFQTPIQKLQLSPRTQNCLMRAQLYTVGDVLKMSDGELLSVNGGGIVGHCGGGMVYHLGQMASINIRTNCLGRMSS